MKKRIYGIVDTGKSKLICRLFYENFGIIK